MIRLRPFRRPTRPAVPPRVRAAGGARAGAASSQAGFTLVELAVVSSVIGVVLAGSMAFMNSYTEGQRRLQVNTQLDTIEEALVLYAAQHRRLPCPADPTETSDRGVENETRDASDEVTGCADNQDKGVVPWRELGLSEDQVIDPWAHYFTYRVDDGTRGDHSDCDEAVSPALHEGMNLTGCRGDSADIKTRLTGVGLRVGNDPSDEDELVLDPSPSATPAPPPTGAAYVLISHGDNGFGATTPGGSTIADNGATAGEQRNFGNVIVDDYRGSASGTSATSYYDGPAADDIVRHMTIMRLAQKAGVGPQKSSGGS